MPEFRQIHEGKILIKLQKFPFANSLTIVKRSADAITDKITI